ncbi:hypothetical protein [Lentzea albida]|nr:hypothetical protein [Lentzea albida]
MVEGRLGFAFPSDFKEIASTFGSGVFHHYVFMLAPAQNESSFSSYVMESEDTLEVGRLRETLPHALFPVSGGLIPWAYAGDACTVFWRTDRGGPDDWTIVACDEQFLRWEEFEGTASDYLAELFSGSLRSELFEFEPEDPLTFYAQPGKVTEAWSNRPETAGPEGNRE